MGRCYEGLILSDGKIMKKYEIKEEDLKYAIIAMDEIYESICLASEYIKEVAEYVEVFRKKEINKKLPCGKLVTVLKDRPVGYLTTKEFLEKHPIISGSGLRRITRVEVKNMEKDTYYLKSNVLLIHPDKMLKYLENNGSEIVKLRIKKQKDENVKVFPGCMC